MFLGYHLSRYQTYDLSLRDQLVKEVIEQTQFWENTLNFCAEQKKHTLVLSRTSPPTKTEKEKFTVYLLVPLDEEHNSFPAHWEGLPQITLIENGSLRIEQAGTGEITVAGNIT
jgi:hypothetical protein